MYHLADGMVLANYGKKKNEWRKTGIAAEVTKNVVIEVRVDGK